jgi:hypothetical protein
MIKLRYLSWLLITFTSFGDELGQPFPGTISSSWFSTEDSISISGIVQAIDTLRTGASTASLDGETDLPPIILSIAEPIAVYTGGLGAMLRNFDPDYIYVKPYTSVSIGDSVTVSNYSAWSIFTPYARLYYGGYLVVHSSNHPVSNVISQTLIENSELAYLVSLKGDLIRLNNSKLQNLLDLNTFPPGIYFILNSDKQILSRIVYVHK